MLKVSVKDSLQNLDEHEIINILVDIIEHVGIPKAAIAMSIAATKLEHESKDVFKEYDGDDEDEIRKCPGCEKVCSNDLCPSCEIHRDFIQFKLDQELDEYISRDKRKN